MSELLVIGKSSPNGEILSKSEGKSFAIIGTRKPTEEQAQVALHLAFVIAIIGGHLVTTGAADGIDKQAMDGTRGKNLEVYLPWMSYNRDIIPSMANIIVYNPSVHTDWTASVHRFHPKPTYLSRGAFALHARNFGIIKGRSGIIALPGDSSGGTDQGIRIARALKIPIIIGRPNDVTDVARWMGKALQFLGLAGRDLKPTISGRNK